MLSKNQLGFLYMFMSVCAFSIMDLIVKWSEHYPLGQVLFFRGFFGVILYFCLFIYFAIITKGHSLFAFLTAFIIGLSYLHPFLETFFLAHGFIVGLYLRKARKKVINE